MTRYMADSVDGSALVDRTVQFSDGSVATISLTAGYANGGFHASSQDHGATDVQIDVRGDTPGADVLDIENGDASPQQAAVWAHSHNASGYTNYPAILYVNRTNIHEVANVLTSAGLLVNRDYKWWISTLDGTVPSDLTGVVAVQSWNAGNFAPRNIDLSIVYDDSWKPTDAKTFPPDLEDEEMYPITVEMSKGRAFATFEVGSNSKIVSELWVAAKALWGDLPPVKVTVEGDSGTVQVLTTQEFKQNERHWWKIPAGMSNVTFEWDESKVTSETVLSGYVIWR